MAPPLLPRDVLESLAQRNAAGEKWKDLAAEASAREGRTILPQTLRSSCAWHVAGYRRPGTTATPATSTRPPSQDGVSDAEIARLAEKFRQPPRPVGDVTRVLYVPDAHHPYVDRLAWVTMLEAAREFRPDEIVVLGDFCDMAALSSHERDMTKRMSLEEEVAASAEALDELDAVGAKRKWFARGNHEDRWDRHLAKHSPDMFHMLRLTSVLRLADRGWTDVEYRKSVTVSGVVITHDQDRAGQNAHHFARVESESDTIIGHTHRMASVMLGSIGREPRIGVMVGCLLDKSSIRWKSDVRVEREWIHGFGLGFRTPAGKTHIQPVPIIDGQCFVNGTLVDTRTRRAA